MIWLKKYNRKRLFRQQTVQFQYGHIYTVQTTTATRYTAEKQLKLITNKFTIFKCFKS